VRRREFITLIGGAAAAWPLTAPAQQPMPVLGYLDPTSPGDFVEPRRGFLQGLKETGYIEGENVAISYRFAENQIDRLPELADDLVRRQVAVIFTFASGAFAAKAATTTISIVFVLADDPVRLGLVPSIARPGGNLTGINFLSAELGAKRLELLRELVPAATRICFARQVECFLRCRRERHRGGCSPRRAANPGCQSQYQPGDRCCIRDFCTRPTRCSLR
jgi:putative tryptophan/tyrosine transport system substrate-binding protein